MNLPRDLITGSFVGDNDSILDGVLDWIDLPQTEADVTGIESYNFTHNIDSDFDEFSSSHVENGFILDDDDSFHSDYDSLDSDDI